MTSTSPDDTSADRVPATVDPRIMMAAERTFLAWVRTSVALMGFGFVVARFAMFVRELAAARGGDTTVQHGVSVTFGVALVVLGVVFDVFATVEHVRFRRRAARGDTRAPVRSYPIWAALCLAVIGAALVVALVVLA